MRAKTFVDPPGSAASAVSRAGQAVGRLVQRAVAAEHDDHVDPVGGGALGEAGGVAPPVGLGQGHVVVGRQRLLDHHRLRAVTDDADELTSSRSLQGAADGTARADGCRFGGPSGDRATE